MTFLLFARESQQSIAYRPVVYRLVLAPASLLYPYSAGRVEWLGLELRLFTGVYAVGVRYLAVDDQSGTFITEAAALDVLGAGEALEELGLGDAAISLGLGDLTNARYQWLRHRAGH